MRPGDLSFSKVARKPLVALKTRVCAPHIGGLRGTHREVFENIGNMCARKRAQHTPPYPPTLRGTGRDREGPPAPGVKRTSILHPVWCAGLGSVDGLGAVGAGASELNNGGLFING